MPATWTKQMLVQTALEEIGLGNYIFDVEPERIQGALNRLDVMMTQWTAYGIELGYDLPAEPGGSSLQDESGIPDTAVEAVYLNLALNIAPTFGREPMSFTRARAKDGYHKLLIAAAEPVERQQDHNAVPAGAGNKAVNRPFLDEQPDLLDDGSEPLEV